VSNPFVGEIRMFGGNFAPAGWAFCNGALMAIADNDTLFNLIGTTYGGDGVSTFALPNLQSRIPLHVGPNHALAQSGGVESVTLTVQQLPAHTHPVSASSAATIQDPAGAYPAGGSVKMFSTQAPDQTLNAAQVTPVGGSQPHSNIPPVLAVNFIISLFGIFPSQN
jgi:microcystin-dependent protein